MSRQEGAGSGGAAAAGDVRPIDAGAAVARR